MNAACKSPISLARAKAALLAAGSAASLAACRTASSSERDEVVVVGFPRLPQQRQGGVEVRLGDGPAAERLAGRPQRRRLGLAQG